MALVLMGFTSARAASNFSLSVGTDDFYLSVGNYDYLPYSYDVNPGYVAPRINFTEVMADYGNWVYVPTFGQVWRPYVDSSWRPYSNGHWIYTSYGPTWQGYEPWAWAAYHYGNWIWDQRYGWVWIPGYDWSPGNVVWSRSYDTIGWMPAPPRGYDYSRGYLNYRGNVNQFTYDDPNFFDDDYYGYGGGYYNQGYGNQGYDDFYNQNYTNISINLWVFINQNHYGYNNYADYYLDRDYTRDVFRRRMVRINSKPIQRAQLERVTRTRINEVPVRVKEFDTDKRRVKMVIPEGEEENVRKNANKVVQNMIAPAFAEKQKPFKGLKATNEKNVAKIFKQENKQPKIETVSPEVVINKAKENNKRRDAERLKVTRQEIEKVDKVEKEAKTKNNNQTPKPKPTPVTEPTLKVPSNQDVKTTKPSSNLNTQQPKQNASPNTKPKQTENPYVKPQNVPSNTNQDRDAQFSSDKDKNKSKDVNPNQNPYAEEEKIKKQSEERIKQADQNKKKAEEQAQQADVSKKKAQDQLRKANEDPNASSEKMKQEAESQIQQADKEKQSAEEQIQNAEKTKQQAEEESKQADENTKKKKTEQNKKQKDKDKDKDKPPPRRSF